MVGVGRPLLLLLQVMVTSFVVSTSALDAGAPPPPLDPPDTPEADTLQLDIPQMDTLNLEGLDSLFRRQGRHFSTMDLCGDAICDQIVRQANGLARIKMVRKYILDTVSTVMHSNTWPWTQ